jgi:hypothetical protein
VNYNQCLPLQISGITGWLMNREQLLNHLIKLMFIYKHPFGKVLPIAVLEAMALQNQ